MSSSVNKRILALCLCCSCVAHAGLLLGIADTFKHRHFTSGQALSVSLRQETARLPAAPELATSPGRELTWINPARVSTGINHARESTGPADSGIPPRPSTGLRQRTAKGAVVAMMTTEDTTGDTQSGRSPITHQARSPSAQRNPAPATVPPEISLQVRLNAMMSSYFSYPLLARQRNWQGEVRLGLRVEANGRLSHIHIVKSSGYTLLDHAAQKSLEQVVTIPDAAGWLQGRHFDTVIPVEYRLIDS